MGKLTVHTETKKVSESCLLEKLVPQVRDQVASLNIDREFLASWAVHENLHFPSCYVLVQKLINNNATFLAP